MCGFRSSRAKAIGPRIASRWASALSAICRRGCRRGRQIEVEYRYETNGRISVSARVPCVRYSAHLEITPNGSHNLADLEVWRARLLGKALTAGKDGAVSPGPIALDLNNRASVLKRLDALYEGIGMAAMRASLPSGMQQSRQMAAEAVSALARVQANLQQVERAPAGRRHRKRLVPPGRPTRPVQDGVAAGADASRLCPSRSWTRMCRRRLPAPRHRQRGPGNSASPAPLGRLIPAAGAICRLPPRRYNDCVLHIP